MVGFRLSTLNEKQTSQYIDISKIKKEVENSKRIFSKYGWPTVDVPRKSVEEPAASVIKIYEIKKENG